MADQSPQPTPADSTAPESAQLVWATKIEAPAAVAQDLFTRILSKAPLFRIDIVCYQRAEGTGLTSTLDLEVKVQNIMSTSSGRKFKKPLQAQRAPG
jgi:hypothetical protein